MVLVGWDCIVKILKLYLKISSFVNIISNVNVIANNVHVTRYLVSIPKRVNIVATMSHLEVAKSYTLEKLIKNNPYQVKVNVNINYVISLKCKSIINIKI